MKQLDEYTNINRGNAKFNIVDPYATLVYNSNFGLNINAGARLNNHSIYGSQFVYNFNPNYTFKNFNIYVNRKKILDFCRLLSIMQQMKKINWGIY